MIRRSLPLAARGAEEHPQSWLMISQIEHARVSHQLASEWRGLLADAPPPVRDEVLAAILHHDDGWADWERTPKIDPDHGRPYGFTEMPPAEAQAIWTGSIDVCRRIGPLAGWVVASHFIELQDKQDDDYHDWKPWLAASRRLSDGWLAAWQAADPSHTRALAEDCVRVLQAFDWLSLWLCCRAPVWVGSEPSETLDFGADEGPIEAVTFTPNEQPPAQGELPAIGVAPWPFASDRVRVEVESTAVSAGRYLNFQEVLREAQPIPNGWTLLPGERV